MARPRKSDEQKKKEGTYRKDRAAEPSAQFTTLTKIPPAPDTFDEVARKVWVTICTELVGLGIMQTIDIFQVEIICNSLSIYWKCITEMGDNYIVDTGTGSTKVNPLFNAAQVALTQYNTYASRYGFTPADRMKLKIAAIDTKPKSNPALEIMNRKKLLK